MSLARFGKIGPSWSVSVVFFHQPHYLLVVDDAAFVMQLGSHTPVAVRRPLGADRLDLLDKPSLADGLELRFVIIC